MDINNLKINLGNFLKLDSTKISLEKDNREGAKSGRTSNYQIGLKIDSSKKYSKIQKILMKFMKQNPNCNKLNSNTLKCPIPKNSMWSVYGNYHGPANFSLLYPEKFESNKTYYISHGIAERLIMSPYILRKPELIKMINNMGSKNKHGGKSKKTRRQRKKKSVSKKNNMISDDSTNKLCGKYKDKSVRGTPKNWAYNRCKRTKRKTCKTLPPQGWNMYRYFCE
jgi:hypothetical protein